MRAFKVYTAKNNESIDGRWIGMIPHLSQKVHYCKPHQSREAFFWSLKGEVNHWNVKHVERLENFSKEEFHLSVIKDFILAEQRWNPEPLPSPVVGDNASFISERGWRETTSSEVKEAQPIRYYGTEETFKPWTGLFFYSGFGFGDFHFSKGLKIWCSHSVAKAISRRYGIVFEHVDSFSYHSATAIGDR